MNDGGSLRAVGGVGSEGLSDSVGSDNTSSQGGDNSGEGETHFGLECGICSRNVPEGNKGRGVWEDGRVDLTRGRKECGVSEKNVLGRED